jgi:hypothetical protein
MALRRLSWPSEMQRLTHLGQQRLEVLAGGREQAFGQQHLAAEAVAQDPQDFVADVGRKPDDGQHHATLLAQEGMQPLTVGRGQGA